MRLSFPCPCSNILTDGSLLADAIRACFILAGLTCSGGTPLANNATAPATTGDATLVPKTNLNTNVRLH